MTNTHWWWIRHAKSLGDPAIIHGQDDVEADLSDLESISSLKQRLPEKAIWLTSGIKRSNQTAEAIGTKNFIETPGLMEQDFGDWTGKRWIDLKGDSVRKFWLNFITEKPPGGESFIQMIDRVSDTINTLSREYENKNIVAIAHSGTIKAALANALNLFGQSASSFQINNLSLTEIEIVPDGVHRIWNVIGVNR